MKQWKYCLIAVVIVFSHCTNSDDEPQKLNVATSDESSLSNPAARGKPRAYPSYNTSPLPPDQTGVTLTAPQLAANIRLGWNVGNSLEAIGGETNWGNPLVTKALIDLAKAKGFNAIRVPCNWDQHANQTTGLIDPVWLNRVKTVVQYCIDNGMYVLINTHHDGWLDDHLNTRDEPAVNMKMKAFWEQIATHMRDFDEHLMFGAANEPPAYNATEMSVLTSAYQTFINAVRSTGGRNTYRVLVLQGPGEGSPNVTNTLMNTLPSDPTPNKMMVEVHYYHPWQFCGLTEDQTGYRMFYYWGEGYHSTTDPSRNADWAEEATVREEFGWMKTKFVDKGIPVLLGEYGVGERTTLTGEALTLHLASRAYYLKYVTQQARVYGMLPFYWDNGWGGDGGFAIFDRATNTVSDQQALDALLLGAQ
jgi:endoglucanase